MGPNYADYQFKVMGNRLTNKYIILTAPTKKKLSDFYKVWTLDKEGRLDGQTRSEDKDFLLL